MTIGSHEQITDLFTSFKLSVAGNDHWQP